MYCDHLNLVHIFAPHAAVKEQVGEKLQVKEQAREKLQRWAAKLTELKVHNPPY